MFYGIIFPKIISLELIKASLITSSNLQRLYCAFHSNTEEKSVFSRIRKNLTPQRAGLELNGTLASITRFQLNNDQGERCYQYKPSEKVISRSKKVTREYNKKHSSKANEK